MAKDSSAKTSPAGAKPGTPKTPNTGKTNNPTATKDVQSGDRNKNPATSGKRTSG